MARGWEGREGVGRVEGGALAGDWRDWEENVVLCLWRDVGRGKETKS